MKARTAVYKVKALLQTIRDDGLENLGRRVIEHARARLGFPSQSWAAYRQHKAKVDAAFDGLNGVETSGVQHLRSLTIASPNSVYGVNHVASDPEEFAEAISDIEIDLIRSTFVDLGSGKGRAVLMATGYPFARIVGVEFASELHEVAKANVAHFSAHGDVSRIELILGDATLYDFPATPLVIYLFNPFGAPIVAKIAQRAMSSLRLMPRPMVIIYVNPLHADQFVAAGWRATKQRRAYSIFTTV